MTNDRPSASWFTRFSRATAHGAGQPVTFSVAVLLILVWAITGPMFEFGTTWQLVINTATTIITFLMVFVIQSTQNRDSEAMHLKLDELLRATRGASDALMDLEELEEKQLDELREKYREMATKARAIEEKLERHAQRHL
jgi:low affinity Fe/Cu permease